MNPRSGRRRNNQSRYIKEIETKKINERINKIRSKFSVRISKTERPLARLTRKIRENAQIYQTIKKNYNRTNSN